MRVLIVDDDVYGADALGFLFESAGCHVCVVYSGYEAISAAAQFTPDVVVLEISMPGMDGFQAADALRKQLCANLRKCTRRIRRLSSYPKPLRLLVPRRVDEYVECTELQAR